MVGKEQELPVNSICLIISKNLWIFLVLLYGVIKGVREGVKKQALKKNSIPEVLFYYTFFGFILVLPASHEAFPINSTFLFVIFIKSLVIFIAWIFAFKAIKRMPISIYGVTEASRILFSVIMGVVFLHESMSVKQILGMIMVVIGIYFANCKTGNEQYESNKKYIFLIFISCFLNAVSSMIDKTIMRSGSISSGQLQFWYMLFLSLMYLVYMFFSGLKVDFAGAVKNYWIIILSIIFIIGDRSLFIANSYPESRVSVMTLLKQSSIIVTILTGRMFFKEKNILYKLICATVIILGIFLATV